MHSWFRPALAACAGVLTALRGHPAAAADRPPNIVFILIDDLGWRDFGCYGTTFYETPNIDRLARQGMRFTAAYAAGNVCSPTRSSIMTGKYPARLGITDWLPGQPDSAQHRLLRAPVESHLPPNESTIGSALKEYGYDTGFIGKWHLGGGGFTPDHFGFDVNIAGSEWGSPKRGYFSPYHMPHLTDGPPGEYLTDRLTEEAVRYCSEHRQNPFLLYLAHYAVHVPIQGKAALVQKYRRKQVQLGLGANDFGRDLGYPVRQVQDNPAYAAMVESVDRSVGEVLAALARLGLDQNTVVILTSDNGGLAMPAGAPTSNAPLRAGKGWNYEGGIREPLIVRWPGVVAAGAINSTAVISPDFYPTLRDIAGMPAAPARDGVSLVPLLKGAGLSERPLFWHYPHYSDQKGRPSGAVRLGDYKLVEWFEDERFELYDLKDDLEERHDLANALPGKTAELKRLLQNWRRDVGARMPRINPNYRAAAAQTPRGQEFAFNDDE